MTKANLRVGFLIIWGQSRNISSVEKIVISP
jgi:hypothetical protein